MTTDKLIEMHEQCEKTLYAIRLAQKKRDLKRGMIEQYAGQWPDLENKYLRQIDIHERAIRRLHSVHQKQLRRIARVYNAGVDIDLRENIGV